MGFRFRGGGMSNDEERNRRLKSEGSPLANSRVNPRTVKAREGAGVGDAEQKLAKGELSKRVQEGRVSCVIPATGGERNSRLCEYFGDSARGTPGFRLDEDGKCRGRCAKEVYGD